MNVQASCFVALFPFACAQTTGGWHDPSPRRIQRVTVEEGVLLEVVDWGGSGRPIVRLAGSGNTAHVFDDVAPKLVDTHHVYGITRRGDGESSRPASGYDDQRLADDVFAVVDSLKISSPVLVGRVPVLAFLEIPRPKASPGHQPKNHEERAAIQAHAEAIAAYIDRWIKNLKSGVPAARIVDLAEVHDTSAGHFVFLTREADVVRELRAFLSPAAPNLSGRWEIDANFDDPSLAGGGFDCVLKHEGDRLTGSCQEIPLTGEVKGTHVTWQIKAGQTQDIITYTGTMNESGTSISGRFSMPGKGGRFTASKQ